MSVSSDLLGGACLGFQTRLNETCATSARSKVGFTMALMTMSRLYNPFGVTAFPTDGSSREIKYRYMPRALDDGNYGSVTDICSTASNAVYKSGTLTPDLEDSVEQAFNIDDVRILCDTPSQFQSSVVQGMMDALYRKMNKTNLTYVNTITPYLLGGGAGQYNSDLIQGTAPNEVVDHRELNTTLENLNDIGCGMSPLWVGQSIDLNLATRKLELGCCNNNGLDLSRLNGEFIYFKDNQMNAELGSNHTIAMIPGSMVILPYLRNVGAWAGDFDGMMHETVTDPLTGFTFDLTMNPDKCTRAVTVQLSIRWALWTIPDDYYQSGDPLYQTKGFVRPIVT